MIIVKLLGGARKSFSSEKIEIQKDSMTIYDLLDHLQKNIPKDLPPLDTENILVAVNGVDSSALKGKETILGTGDIVSIIPLVHGGGTNRINFTILNRYVELIHIKKVNDPILFFESLRQRYPDLIIQGIRTKFILNKNHAKKIISISIHAEKSHILLSNKIEIDILMRFACTRQISDAIAKVGVKQNFDSVIIIIGKRPSITKLLNEIKNHLQPYTLFQNNKRFIKTQFGILKEELDCVISDTPLEDLLVERSLTLFH